MNILMSNTRKVTNILYRICWSSCTSRACWMFTQWPLMRTSGLDGVVVTRSSVELASWDLGHVLTGIVPKVVTEQQIKGRLVVAVLGIMVQGGICRVRDVVRSDGSTAVCLECTEVHPPQNVVKGLPRVVHQRSASLRHVRPPLPGLVRRDVVVHPGIRVR